MYIAAVADHYENCSIFILLGNFSCANADRPQKKKMNTTIIYRTFFSSFFLTDTFICFCVISAHFRHRAELWEENRRRLLGLVPGPVLMCECAGQFSRSALHAENSGALHGVHRVHNPGHQPGIYTGFSGMGRCGWKSAPCRVRARVFSCIHF